MGSEMCIRDSNYMLWSESGSGHEELGGTAPPRIPRSTPPPPPPPPPRETVGHACKQVPACPYIQHNHMGNTLNKYVQRRKSLG